MAAGDAKAIPIKNAAFRLTVPVYDADGDPVTGAGSLDSEVSKDAGAFADCTSEATEIGTSGIYYLDLTATEMNADTVVVRVQTSTSGAKTTVAVLYTAARSVNDLAFPNTTGRGMDVDASGGVEVGSFQASAITATAFAPDAIPAGALAADAIGSSELASTAVDEIVAGLIAATLTEITAIPGASPTLAQAIMLLYQGLRNKIESTGTTLKLHTDSGAVLGTSNVTDDGTTMVRNEFA